MQTLHQKRKAFSLLTALTVIVLMATIGVLVLNMSGKIVKSTTSQYQYAQAELYAKSYTEYAILAITGNDRATACLTDITGNIDNPDDGNGYRIRVRIAYIANGTQVDMSKCSSTRVLSGSVTSTRIPLSALIDVYVDYKDPDNINGSWMTVHRRTIQKI